MIEALVLEDAYGGVPSFAGRHLEEMDKALRSHPNAAAVFCLVKTEVDEGVYDLYYSMDRGGLTATTYYADIPDDIDDAEERQRIARHEADYVMPDYFMPANWYYEDDGRIVKVTREAQYTRRF